MTPLLAALRAAVGAEQVLTEGDLSAYELDWRKRFRGRALAVVRPADTAQVAAVLHACAVHGASVVPQGGNTGLVGGGVPDASGTQVLLSLTRLNRVRTIDRANLTLTAEAGCVLQALQQAAAEAGLLLPLLLPLPGLWRARMYTYRWVSLLVWIYFAEGVVRATTDKGLSAVLAGVEVVLCLVLFVACALHVRWRLHRAAREAVA